MDEMIGSVWRARPSANSDGPPSPIRLIRPLADGSMLVRETYHPASVGPREYRATVADLERLYVRD